jgi:hypothetical protein
MEKSKVRIRAEEAMRKMDALRPCLAIARKAYIDLMCEYERECQIVRSYARRGIVSPEEKERYMIRNVPELAKVSLTEAMKESAKKRGTSRPKKEKRK